MPHWKILMKWLRDNNMRVLKWPGNSRGMNPIESLWDILKHEIHSEPTNKPLITKNELTELLVKVWFCSEKINLSLKNPY